MSKKPLAKSSKEDIPSLDQQLEDLLVFVDVQFHENEDLLDLPINPPKCEMKRGPARFGSWEDPDIPIESRPPLGNVICGFKGAVAENMRGCPHCSHLVTANPRIGSTVTCWNCAGIFMWGST